MELNSFLGCKSHGLLLKMIGWTWLTTLTRAGGMRAANLSRIASAQTEGNRWVQKGKQHLRWPGSLSLEKVFLPRGRASVSRWVKAGFPTERVASCWVTKSGLVIFRGGFIPGEAGGSQALTGKRG